MLRVLLTVTFACTIAACARDVRRGAAEAHPQRIVALTVGAVDTLARLGELDRVVAVEEDCLVPGTESLVRIRNDDHSGPSRALNVEAVLALQPDLVIAKEDLRAALDQRGVAVLWVPSTSDLATIERTIDDLGERLGVPDKAHALVRDMRARRDAIAARVAGRPQVKVYYEAGRAGRTAGRGTVVDEMIRLAGGVNVAGELPLANPVLASDAIVAANPDVIVLSPWSDAPEDVARRPGWDHIAAVRAARVHRLTESERQVQYPSPSCIDGCAALFVPWFHPDVATPTAAGR